MLFLSENSLSFLLVVKPRVQITAPHWDWSLNCMKRQHYSTTNFSFLWPEWRNFCGVHCHTLSSLISLLSSCPFYSSKEPKKQPGSHATSSSETVVTYFFCGEEIPYRRMMKTHSLTLGHFKEQLRKKGNYRCAVIPFPQRLGELHVSGGQ